MSAEPAQLEEKELLEEIRRWLIRLRELEARTPGSGLKLLASAEAEGGTSSALEALFALNVLHGLNAQRPGTGPGWSLPGWRARSVSRCPRTSRQPSSDGSGLGNSANT